MSWCCRTDFLKMVAEAMKACEWNDSGDGDEDEQKKISAVLNNK